MVPFEASALGFYRISKGCIRGLLLQGPILRDHVTTLRGCFPRYYRDNANVRDFHSAAGQHNPIVCLPTGRRPASGEEATEGHCLLLGFGAQGFF